MIIRNATQADMTRIVELSEEFYKTTHYHNRPPMCPLTVGMLVSSLIEHAVMIVAEEDGEIVGMIGTIVTPYIFNNAYNVASEIVWYVSPTSRTKGIGPSLIAANEAACNEFENLVRIQMVDLPSSPPEVQKFYEKCGYFLSERIFTKMVE